MDVDQLKRALLEHGFHEAASLVDADIERQQVEDDRERDEDEVIRANFERMRERDSGGSGSADYGWAYARDRQEGQPLRLELWCEAAGMAPQLARHEPFAGCGRVADHYSVPVYSSGGFASLTAEKDRRDGALERALSDQANETSRARVF